MLFPMYIASYILMWNIWTTSRMPFLYNLGAVYI